MRGAQANGKQIQAARLARGLTQEQLASQAGVDVKTVHNAERNRRVDLGTLTRISFSLDVDVGNLIITTRPPLELEVRRRDAIRRWHHAWDTRDMDALLSLYDDDAVVHLPGAPDIPFAGEHRGREAIRRAHEIAWKTCETEPMLPGDCNLLVSDNTVIENSKRGIRLPDGDTAKLSSLLIFTFLHDSELVVDQRVEYDTLNFARLMQFRPSGAAAPTEESRTSPPPESSR